MLKFTRRGWLASLLAALAATFVAFVPGRARAAPVPPPPRKRKRWIGHY